MLTKVISINQAEFSYYTDLLIWFNFLYRMLHVRWITHEARARDAVPYVNGLRRAGYPQADVLYHSSFHRLPGPDVLVPRLHGDTSSNDGDCDHHHVFIVQHSEDYSYRLGVWGCSQGYEQVRTAENLVPLLELPNTHVIVLQQDFSMPLNDIDAPSGTESGRRRVVVATSGDQVLDRLRELHPPESYIASPRVTTVTTTTVTTVTTTTSTGVEGECSEHSVTETRTEVARSIDEPSTALPLAKRLIFIRHAQRLDEVREFVLKCTV